MNNLLKGTNLKNTKNRRIILDIITKSKMPISAEQIYKECVKHNSMNLSTIYRTLNTLEEVGVLIKAIRQNGVAYYQENKHDHIHLLLCTNCNKKVLLDICPWEKALNEVAEQTKYKVTCHNIELYGLCPECQKLLDNQQ